MSITQQIQHSVPLAPYTTFHIGGLADYFFVAKTVDELLAVVKWGREKQLPLFILGKGANILIGDKGVRGLVIKNEANKVSIKRKAESEKEKMLYAGSEAFLTAESGAEIGELIKITAEKGLSGLEHYAGIPSTVGGAIWQNLHFLNAERTDTVFIADIVIGADILTKDNKIRHVDRDYFHFDYDWSEIHKTHDIVLSVTMELKPLDKAIIEQRIQANLQWRQEKHPKGAYSSSAGSVFKNIPGHGAGRIIDRLGLKGKQIGGAQISPQHANFIVNTGNATASDVLALIKLVQKEVKEKEGLDIEPEITLMGEF